jgi:hypothetical protein
MTDVANTPVDDLEDDMFDNKGTGSGLDPYEGQYVLFVPTSFIKNGGKSLNDGTPIDVIDTIIVGFVDGEDPDETSVRVFSGSIVSTLRKAALFNESVDKGTREGQPSGLPKMVIGRLFKDEKNKKRGQNAAWALEKIEDTKVIARMKAYALANLRESNPFEDGN